MKKFKSLASAHIRKIAILLVISTLSSTTQSTTQSTKPTTEQGHVHTWTTETYYTTETQKVHHDAVTHQETTYTTETQTIEHDGYACSGCGAWRNLSFFFSGKKAYNKTSHSHQL